MPKRQCPFGESSSHQWKMHVGKKEVDMGVRSEELMKSVYEKTRQMLFKGASKCLDINENHVYWPPEGVSRTVSTIKLVPGPGQLYLNNCGHLMTTPGDMVMPWVKREIPLEHRASAEVEDNSADGDTVFYPKIHHPQTCGVPAASVTILSAMDCDVHLVGHGIEPATDVNQTLPSVSSMKEVNNSGDLACGFMHPTSAGGKACQSCRKPLGYQHWMSCSFCERQVCADCVRQCDRCTSDFCHFCSVLNYGEAMERAFCLGCNR